MARARALLVASVLVSILAALGPAGPSQAGDICSIEVTTTADNIIVDNDVTLREAISFATGVFDPAMGEPDHISGCPPGFEDNPGALTEDSISFDSVVFPPTGAPGTINLTMGPLPALSSGNDSIRAFLEGVLVDGGGADTCFRITSSNNEIIGIQIRNCGVGIMVEGQTGVPLRATGPQGPIAVPANDNLMLFNVIGDNDVGIYIFVGAADNILSGNSIGTNLTGDAADSNNTGVLIRGSNGNRVGGIDGVQLRQRQPAGDLTNIGNVISGNVAEGVRIEGGGGNSVHGNLIGTNIFGDAALPNGGTGVEILNSPGNIIGSPVGNGSNVISGNGEEGVKIHGDEATNNVVRANNIGVNTAGDGDIGNGNSGVYIIHAPDNTIGGASAAERNVISGNDGFAGVAICGNAVFCGGQDFNSGTDDASGTEIVGNYIGTNAAGSAAIPNLGSGVTLDGTADAIIGGLSAGAGNVISGNEGNGVTLFAGASDSLIASNYVGVDSSGMVPVSNGNWGIVIEGAPNNQVGQPGAGNVISGNGAGGVGLFAPESMNNRLQSNVIGVAADGQTPAGNGFGGVFAAASGPNVIGGDGGGEGNVIAHNVDFGVGITLSSGPSISKRISANLIYSNDGLGIDLEGDGVTPNDILDGDMGGNALQNYPGLIAATVNGGTHVEGALNSAANTQYRIEFFANDECDPSGHGEGQTYLGFTNATTDGTGTAQFSADLPVAASVGDQITATATDPEDNTSEFSSCIVAQQGEGTPLPTPTPTPPVGSPTPTGTPTPTPTLVPGGILGDTDCDLDVDAVDALKVLQDVAGLDPDAECLGQGDVQCDGDRDAVDALGILINVAALPPQPQEPDCPAIGDPVA